MIVLADLLSENHEVKMNVSRDFDIDIEDHGLNISVFDSNESGVVFLTVKEHFDESFDTILCTSYDII